MACEKVAHPMLWAKGASPQAVGMETYSFCLHRTTEKMGARSAHVPLPLKQMGPLMSWCPTFSSPVLWPVSLLLGPFPCLHLVLWSSSSFS